MVKCSFLYLIIILFIINIIINIKKYYIKNVVLIGIIFIPFKINIFYITLNNFKLSNFYFINCVLFLCGILFHI